MFDRILKFFNLIRLDEHKEIVGKKDYAISRIAGSAYMNEKMLLDKISILRMEILNLKSENKALTEKKG